jgi:hypothetical protein
MRTHYSSSRLPETTSELLKDKTPLLRLITWKNCGTSSNTAKAIYRRREINTDV